MDEKYVSIIMSEYNTKVDQFHRSIESVLNQTYKFFELIIIDDCGKNNVEELLKKYDDNRIVVYKNNENKGLAESLNFALKKSKYEYIMRMDTDDIAVENRLEKQIEFAKKNPQYSIIGGRYIAFNEKEEVFESNFFGEVKKEDFLFGTPFAHPTLLLKKEDLLKIGGYPDYKRCQDYAMEMNMYANGYKGYIMNDILLKYRQEDDSYKKRSYKVRIIEYKVRKKFFKKLKIPFYKRFVYELKPLVIGLIPMKLQQIYHEKVK